MYAKLRTLRHSRNIAVEKICSAIGIETPATYYKKETGSLRFSLQEAKTIADLFNLNIEEIFFTNEISKMEQY